VNSFSFFSKVISGSVDRSSVLNSSFVRCAAGGLLVFLFCSCSSTSITQRQYFHDESKADVILQFPSWEAITFTKPNTVEGHFMPFYTRAEAERRLEGFQNSRNLAVVVCALSYSPQQEAVQQREWKSIFSRLGYRRVIFVRPTFTDRVNGSEIVRDMQLGTDDRAGG
jgi:hypothetical protein